MLGGRRNDSYLSTEVSQVAEPTSHHIMSQFCVDMQDQSTARPGSLTLRFDNTPTNYADLKTHQHSRNYPSLKRSESSEKVIVQLENNGINPMTPTSFLNPKEITAEQEQFAEQLTKTIDKIKSEREGSLSEESLLRQQQRHHPSNTSPGTAYPANERSTNPSTPTRVKLCNPDDADGVVVSQGLVSASSMLLSDATAYSMAPHEIHTHEAPIISTNVSPPSTTGDSTSPVSPTLENPNNRFPVVTTATGLPPVNRYSSISLPPLRTGGNANGVAYPSLTDMMVVGASEDPIITSAPVGTLADLTNAASVTGNQLIVNPTTDGFVFQHSTDQNPLMDPNGGRMNGLINQRHLTNLVSSYEGHNLAHMRHHEYLPSGMPNYHAPDQQQDGMMMPAKRPLQSSSMTPSASGLKRSRRRHEPTIAAAQALINASSGTMVGGASGQLSYLPTDMSAMSANGHKMEDRTMQQVQPSVSNAGPSTPRRGNHSAAGISMATYDSQASEASLSNLDPNAEKMEKKRARNRLAARRCRERKISKIQGLENEVAQLSAFTETLRVQLASSRKEAEQLRNCVEQLAETIPGVREQLDAMALSQSQSQQQQQQHHSMQSQGVSPSQAHRGHHQPPMSKS